jgi:hypothetical protein
MTAQVKRFPSPTTCGDFSRCVDDLACQVGVIGWALAGLKEVISTGDHRAGIEMLARRNSARVSKRR